MNNYTDISFEQLWKNNGGADDAYGILDCSITVSTYKGPRLANKIIKTRGKTLIVELDNNETIEGLAEHRLMDADYDWVFLSDIIVGSYVLDANEEMIQVVAIKEGTDQDVYDLHVPGEHHYIANSMISHNSTLANQLAVNFASQGHPVDLMPLEMSEQEMTVRIMATVTKSDSLKILLQKLTPQEQKFIEEKFLKWRKYLNRKKSWYSITKPKEDVGIDEALSLLSVYNSKVKIIDYLGLLAGTDGDDQWRKLGAAARASKIFAENTNSVVIILAQLDEQGKVRYSRAIGEHASNFWTFVSTPETREAGIITINQTKARNQRAFTFSLKVDGAMMRVTDLPNNGVDYNNNGLSKPVADEMLPNLADSL